MSLPLDRLVEALLLVSDEPLSPADIARIVGVKKTAVAEALMDLGQRLSESDVVYQLRELNGKYELALKHEYSQVALRLNRFSSPRKLSDASIETLALIAYYQPISRAEIARIRGVSPDSSLSTLLEAELIKKTEAGYVTTENFLRLTGISSLKELPPLKDGLDAIGKDS